MTGLELRTLRKKLDLSRQGFATIIGVSIHTLDAWEGGKRNIPETKKELILRKTKDIVPMNLKGIGGKLYTKNKDGIYENISNPEDQIIPDGDDNINILDQDKFIVKEPVSYIQNKNGLKYEELPNGKFRVKVPKVPFCAYASFIEVFEDEYDQYQSFDYTYFVVDHPGKGNYIAFTTKNDSMNGGNLNDTPGEAEVLGRELQRHHWIDGFKTTEYGWIIVSYQGMMHKDIEGPDGEGNILCKSRNPSPEFPEFKLKLEEIHSIWKVIKRTF